MDSSATHLKNVGTYIKILVSIGSRDSRLDLVHSGSTSDIFMIETV